MLRHSFKITLSQPDQVNATPIRGRAPQPFNHDCFCFAPISSDLSESRLEKTGDNESAFPSPPGSSSERTQYRKQHFKDPLSVWGYRRRECRGGDERGRGQQGSGPPLIHRLEATAGPPLGPEGRAVSLPPGGGQLSTMSSKGSNFLQSLHSAGSNQRNRTADSLKPCCFLGRGRWGLGVSEVLGALEPQGEEHRSPGQQGEEQEPW